jgi:drug/metabolite transporter (DMT)-like permease
MGHHMLNKNSPLFNVLLFSSFWALQIFIAKLAFLSGVKVLPFQIQAALAALAVLALSVFMSVSTELAQMLKRQPATLWKLLLANAIHFGLGSGLSIIGIALTDAINAGFLVKLATLSTTLFAWLLLGERMSRFKTITLSVMLLGAYLLTTKAQSLLPRIGDLFLLAACICWSLGNVLIRKILRAQPVSADIVSLLRPIAGLPVFLGFILLAELQPAVIGPLKGVLSGNLLAPAYLPYTLSGGLALALTWIYLNRTLKVATASYMTMMSMVTPVLVSLLAVLILGEHMVWVQLLGGGLIILSGVATYFSDIAYA